MNSWILVIAIAAISGPTIHLQDGLKGPQCAAMANVFMQSDKGWAACYGPDGQEVVGKKD